MPAEARTDVVTTGAGVAGIAAARHQWQRDTGGDVPEARARTGGRVFAASGAYSYPLGGSPDAARRLARPIRRMLFIAGEATDSEGRTTAVHCATTEVHCATTAGYRAAARVARAFARR